MSRAPDRYAVVGHPVDHSRSPAIHARFATQTGQVLSYERLPAAPDAFVETARRFFDDGGVGLNVTLPFKQEAAELADELSARAAAAGAVNTLMRRDDGSLFGDNTDGAGLLRELADNMGLRLAGMRILILGAGGATRGVVPVLLEAGPAELTIANRSVDKAAAIVAACRGLGDLSACALDALPAACDIVINAISAGLHGDMPALDVNALSGAAAAYDMIYADKPTPFLRWAAARGVPQCRDGFGMLVEQAAESFFLWRGVRPDTAPVIAERP